MRIFTKKAFKFMNRENGSFLKTQPFSFQEVPEWVEKDPIYALAIKEDSIEPVESKQRQKQLENDPDAKKMNRKKAGSTTDSEKGKENSANGDQNPKGAGDSDTDKA